jgi:hypothetical protein
MPQHTEFMNGTYNYPAKPRNMWEVGVKAGLFTINGDVNASASYGVGAHIRKAFGYLFSARLSYMQGIGKGLNWQPSGGYRNNPKLGLTAMQRNTGGTRRSCLLQLQNLLFMMFHWKVSSH